VPTVEPVPAGRLGYRRDMNLPEELVLLAYSDDGTPEIDGTHLDNGLGGALLLELALAERVGIQDKNVVLRDRTPTGDALVDDALARIAAEGRARKPGHWVQKLAKGTRARVLDGLVARAVLRRDRGKVLGLFSRTVYPAPHGVEPAAETDARTRLRSAVAASGEVAARTSALCALVGATGLERKVFADMDRKQVKRRLTEISEGEWAAAAVKKTIDEIQAAVMVAVIAATAGATTGGS
jgi:hypothetical protein